MTDFLEYPIKMATRLALPHTFALLSLSRFDEVQDYLSFPFRPSPEIRQLAHDFAVSYLLFIRYPEALRDPERIYLSERLEVEPLKHRFLERLSPDSFEQRLYTLFQMMDAELKSLNCDEAIYQWTAQTHTYHKYADRQKIQEQSAINSVCGFLYHWATEFWRNQPLSPETEPYSDKWGDLFEDRLRVFSYAKPRQFQLFPLSVERQHQLQTVVLDFEAERLILRRLVEDMFKAPRHDWDDLMWLGYGAHTLILNEGHDRLQLKEWNAFSADEFAQIKAWIFQHKDTMSPRLTFIPDL